MRSRFKGFLARYGLSVRWLVYGPKLRTLRTWLRNDSFFKIYLHPKMQVAAAPDSQIKCSTTGLLHLNQAIPKTSGLPGALVMQSAAIMKISGRCVLSDGVFITIEQGGCLELGEVYANRKLEINCRHHITIGNGVALGPDVMIMDSDSHRFDGDEIKGAPIVIGNRVWLGARVVVLKGVVIGDGSVVGVGSVVTKSIPPNSLAVGSPARVIKTGISWRG